MAVSLEAGQDVVDLGQQGKELSEQVAQTRL
jgi:hypothetical protein